jgi:hypothetical protein
LQALQALQDASFPSPPEPDRLGLRDRKIRRIGMLADGNGRSASSVSRSKKCKARMIFAARERLWVASALPRMPICDNTHTDVWVEWETDG